jgi:hypothetical protein
MLVHAGNVPFETSPGSADLCPVRVERLPRPLPRSSSCRLQPLRYTSSDGGRRVNDTLSDRDGESIWIRLRRRRVVQWGVAYAASAWVLLQVLGFVSDTFTWPTAVKQVATILLAIGLPIVLVIGWYHGERGQQRVSGPELALLTLLVLIGGGLLWFYAHRREATIPTIATSKPTSTAAVTDTRPSIAVLPFDNRSRLDDDAYFVDGIHDDILTQLSKISALRVISRTSVEQFRETKLPLRAIADQLGSRRFSRVVFSAAATECASTSS